MLRKFNLLQTEIDEWKKKYDELMEKYKLVCAELEASKDKLIFYENKIAMLSGELNRTKSVQSKCANELDDYKKRCEGFESSVGGMQTQLERYEIEIGNLHDRNQYLLVMTVLNLAEIDGLRARYVEKVGS